MLIADRSTARMRDVDVLPPWSRAVRLDRSLWPSRAADGVLRIVILQVIGRQLPTDVRCDLERLLRSRPRRARVQRCDRHVAGRGFASR